MEWHPNMMPRDGLSAAEIGKRLAGQSCRQGVTNIMDLDDETYCVDTNPLPGKAGADAKPPEADALGDKALAAAASLVRARRGRGGKQGRASGSPEDQQQLDVVRADMAKAGFTHVDHD